MSQSPAAKVSDAAVTPASPRRILTASLVGTAVEFYDFYIYATAAALVFPALFFPGESASARQMMSFASFAVAFFARPIGAAVFGHFGDRIGRKRCIAICFSICFADTFFHAFSNTLTNTLTNPRPTLRTTIQRLPNSPSRHTKPPTNRSIRNTQLPKLKSSLPRKPPPHKTPPNDDTHTLHKKFLPHPGTIGTLSQQTKKPYSTYSNARNDS